MTLIKSQLSSCLIFVGLLTLNVFFFEVNAAQGAADWPQRPRLFLLKLQDLKAVYVLPLVLIEPLESDGKSKLTIFQFSETRLESDTPRTSEEAWYRIYDYGPGGREAASGFVPDLTRFAHGAILPQVRYNDDYPSLPLENTIPGCKPGRYLVYRSAQKFYIQVFFPATSIAFGFSEYAPIRELFNCADAQKAEYVYVDGQPDPNVVRIYNVPGDVRPRDNTGEIKAVVYSNDRTSLAAVVTVGDMAKNLSPDERNRLYFDLKSNPAPITGKEGQVLGLVGAPASWLIGLPLRYAFFSSSETVTEVTLGPGAFRRLASVAIHPVGSTFVPNDDPGALSIGFQSDFGSNKNPESYYTIRAVNLEQRYFFDRFGRVDKGIVGETWAGGPIDWIPNGAFEIDPRRGVFRDLKVEGQYTRLRGRLVHQPTQGAFRLIWDNDEVSWFYIQETEISIQQWKSFLKSPNGRQHLKELASEYQEKVATLKIAPDGQLPADPFVRFLLLAATRMKDKMPLAGEANPKTPLEVLKWQDTKPMVYLSVKDAQAYCEWLTASSTRGQIRLPNTDEWQRAARGEDLRRAVDGGANLRNLVWVQRPEGPHNVVLPEGGGWFSRGDLVSMFGNVAELVKDEGEKISALGASYRTVVTEPNDVLSYVKPMQEAEASIFIGFRPVIELAKKK